MPCIISLLIYIIVLFSYWSVSVLSIPVPNSLLTDFETYLLEFL